jgi:deoxycytidine triphosphate deaminase
MPQLTPAQERFLWQDPYPNQANGGDVLQATEIRNYVNNYNLLIDQDHFLTENLKQASYTMRPHPNDAWVIDEAGRHKPLRVGNGLEGPYYIVPRNSFVFIKLLQTLRLPFYIIGRHNLKIRYVYSGLLLGTGPQVDPGYEGQLYIPLHNFTDEDVNVYINESFVSIDFSRTSQLSLGPNPPTRLTDFYATYEKLLALIPREKIDERKTLKEYLGSTRPRSSLGPLVRSLEVMQRKFERRRLIEIGVLIGLVSVGIAVVGLAFSLDKKIDANRDTDAASIREIQNALSRSSTTGAVMDVEIKGQINQLVKDLAALREEVNISKTQQPVPTVSPIERKRPR